MNRVFKQWLAGLLAVGMAFTLLPAVAWAADYDVAERSVLIDGDGSYTVTGSTDANTITVTDGNVTLTLDNVSVTSADGCAFDIQGGNVTLILEGDSVNTFESGNHYAGIHVAEGASLTIRGTGALYATANKPNDTTSGAGIGGNQTDNAGNITIESGAVVAKSNGDGAGIGGGHADDEAGDIYGQFQSITITGGTVTAESTGNGAGIGCGCWAKAMGAISITSGEIHAKSGSPDGRSYDIGYGHKDRDFESNISITGGVIFTEGDHQRGIGAGNVSRDDCLIFPCSGDVECYGDPTITGDITIPTGRTLTVPADSTLTVAAGATLTVAPGAVLEVEGAVQNDGAIDQYGAIDGEVGGKEPVRYELTVTAPSFDSPEESYDQPEAKPITIENTGTGTVTISQVELIGSDFTLGEGDVGSLAGGESNTTWTVQPAAGLECGHYEAEITVTCEDGVTAADTVSFNVLGTPVSYLDSDGAEKTCEVYRLVKSDETTWRDDWYVVRESFTVNGRITVSGDVHLILMDGCTLTANGGINVSEGNALTIYGQTAGTGRLDANGSSMCGGIGGGQRQSCGAITINGGTIYAKGGQDGAGIGGGSLGNGGTITINGGTVTAEGGHDPNGYYMTGGAGIGGGRESNSGGTITINGGTVTATGTLDSAGIGGGGSSGYSPASGGDITITGGTVTATGGGDAPGIGGGRSTPHGNLGASGSFSTGEDGNAVIHTNNGIQDDSGTDGWSGVVFDGDSGTVYGSPTLTEDLEIQAGQTLTIPEESTLTVAEGAALTNNGEITNHGTLDNQGTVTNNGRILNDGGTTTGNDIAGAQPEKLAYSLRVSDITFENGADGARPEEKPIVIRNTGLNDVTIESVTVGEGFELTAGDVGTLAAGAQNTSWKLRPQADLFGGHTATITVTYSADGASQTATAEAAFTVSGAGASYQIPDAATLKALRDYINSDSGHGRGETFVLTADIDLENEPWTPIGDGDSADFQGTFDGAGHTIRGLLIDPAGELASAGLFGINEGTIRDLNVSGTITVSGGEEVAVGGIAGANMGTVADCSSEGTVTVEGGTISEMFGGYIGGIVGMNMGRVTGCDSAARVSFTADGGDAYVVACAMGGIVGMNAALADQAAIENCRFSGQVTGAVNGGAETEIMVGIGGVIGINESMNGEAVNGMTVENCENSGTVTGTIHGGVIQTGTGVGGILGSNDAIYADIRVKNCLNTGAVSLEASDTSEIAIGAGGIVGTNVSTNTTSAIVERCCNSGAVTGTGDTVSGAVVGRNVVANYSYDYESLMLLPGAASEPSAVNMLSNGAPVALADTIADCYYLSGAAAGGVGEGDGVATEKSEAQFASGEVAWLLQSGQDSQVWGQALPADRGPVLTGEAAKAVHQVTFQADGTEYAVAYANPAGLAALPAAPALAGLAFDHWSTENSAAGERFDSTTPVTGDITLYAVGRSTFGGESDAIALTTTYGTALTADLAQYVRYESAPETPAPGKFTYTITAGNETLGAETAGDLLTIPGTASAGSYTLTIQAAETEPGYTLMSVESYGADPVTLTVTVTIAKADPKVTAPTPKTLTYTGAAQELVEAGKTTGGTMQYSLDGTTYSAAIPMGTDAGAYTVWYKVAGDANHNDSAPQSVPVTIAKADPEVAAPAPKTLTYTGAAQELVEAGKTTGGTMQYSLDGAAYSAAIPTGTNAQTYTVWYQVAGDANHNDAAPQSVTVTIEKAEGRGRVTMEDYLCGQTDVDPVAQSDTNGTERVTYAYTMRGADDYRDTKPTTAGEYTVKAEFPATDNYNAVTATADFKVTHRLPADLDESAEFTCDCDSELRLKEEELTQVPPGLSGLYGDVETLTRALADQVAAGSNYAVFDVKLEVKEGAGAWHDAPEDSVPASGLTVTLPYPAGTNARYTFTAVHMFASGPRAGEMETPEVTNTDQGITFTVTGLSPVCIGWTAPASSSSSSRRGNYSVTLPAKSEGGAVTSDSASARRGSAVTLTVTPEAGYHLAALAVTDRSGKAVALADNGDGTYTFSMPAGPVAVEAEFTACGSARFADLDAAAWYHDYTDYVIAHNLMQGVDAATFAPDQSTTRAMVVTILYRLAGEPGAPRNIAFADVTPGLWYTDAVSWAAANGIVEGYSQDAFGPEDLVTREQLATILYRYAAYKGADVSGQADLTGYADASAVNDWAREGVTWAVQAGLIQGRSATTLAPGGTSTRAELAAVLARYAQAAEEPDQTKA